MKIYFCNNTVILIVIHYVQFIYIYIYIYVCVLVSYVHNNVLSYSKEVSYAHQGCIYLIQNTEYSEIVLQFKTTYSIVMHF